MFFKLIFGAMTALTNAAMAVAMTPANAISNGTHLAITAIVTNAQNNSAFQCWSLNTPFLAATSSAPGAASFPFFNLGSFDNGGYLVTPPYSNQGVHTAAKPQLVHAISGLLVISVPNDEEQEPIQLLGGPSGLLLALDTEGTGHETAQPSDEYSMGFVLPFKDGIVPEHVVLKDGPCGEVGTFVGFK